MKIWQKLILLLMSIIAISFFIKWWMSYEPMEIIVKNERNESINVSIILVAFNKIEYLNESFYLNENESKSFKNVTNLAGSYIINIKADNMSIEKKIKFGKYYEKIEIIIKNEIIVKNEREDVHFLHTS